MRRASFLLLAIVVAAGCGGGGSGKRLSRGQYASKADAICRKYSAQAKLLAAPKNLSDLGKAFDKALPLFETAIKDLHKLKPPASEQARADQWLAQVESLKNDLAEIRDTYKDRRNVLVPGLNKLGWPVELPKATMFAWAKIPEQYRALGSVGSGTAFSIARDFVTDPACGAAATRRTHPTRARR